jgi:hypothetical protein
MAVLLVLDDSGRTHACADLATSGLGSTDASV